MQIALERVPNALNQIRSYEQGQILINNTTYQESIIVKPACEIKRWVPQYFSELKVEHLQFIEELKPQVIILGTGDKIYFPHPELRLALQKYHCCIEFMDTAAACRTYNVLVSENRDVLAALLVK